MKHLKLSSPTGRNLDLSQYTGNEENRVGDWVVHANDGITEADAWVVLEGAPADDSTCAIPTGRLIFATAEVIQQDDYYLESPSRLQYLQQFDRILTCHPILSDTAERHMPFLPWMINANHGESITSAHPRNLDFLRALEALDKPLGISVVCSTKTYTPEQVLRLRFVEKLVNRFPGKIDWFGNGVRPLAEKWDGIAPYRYSIAIENKSADDVITEKIQDVFLGLAMPVYWGAPNIAEYFDTQALVQIDIRDWRGSCEAIERILDEDPYDAALPAILRNRTLVLEQHHYLRRLVRVLDVGEVRDATRHVTQIRAESSFAGRGARWRRAAGRRLETAGRTLSR